MRVTIFPSVANGSVTAPPSKSVTHRALICAALSQESTVHNVLYSQDIEATLRCLAAMGTRVVRKENSVTLGGLNPFAIPAGTVLDCGESGSTLRFLLPLCLLSTTSIFLTGSQRLFERPLDEYERICYEKGLLFEREKNGVTVCGRLTPGSYCVRGNISSQYITGLMLALPLLEQDSVITIEELFESRSYVRLTQAVQKDFGTCVTMDGPCLFVPGKGEYLSREYVVEGDCSNAAFLEAFNLLGGDVKALGLSPETAQGDRVYKDFYRRMREDDAVFDLSDCPDLGPVMFALAAALGGAKFVGTQRLRLKESDRVDAMAQELLKCGCNVLVGENLVEVDGRSLCAPAQVLCGHNDHRVVMALSLLCAKVGGTIDGAEAVAKSYPGYFDVLRELSVDVRIDE